MIFGNVSNKNKKTELTFNDTTPGRRFQTVRQREAQRERCEAKIPC